VTSLHVVLVEPEIHWNTGNVGRTCLAAGAQLHLVEPLGFSLDEREVRRAGLDYWPRVKPRLWPSWAELERALGAGELGAPFLFAPGRGQSLFETSFPESVAIVLGKESVGLPEDVLDRHAEHVVHLPMLDPELRSINVSTTAGIAMFEVLRQWSAKPAASGRG
jgi:tRNA (cytidine/uridine-2'-O-)-methyltransferase